METLRKWANALDVNFVIEPSESTTTSTQPGTWLQEGVDWVFAMTPTVHVRFVNWQGSHAIREALGSTLQLPVRDTGKMNRIEMVYELLRNQHVEQLAAEVDQTEDKWLQLPESLSFPGYLLMLKRQNGIQTGVEDDVSQWMETIPDIVRAVTGGNWMTFVGQANDVLLYISQEQLSDAALDPPSDTPTTILYTLAKALGVHLTQVIAEDAFFDTRVIVSKVVRHRGDIYRALASVALVDRVMPRSKAKVDVYAESPLALLVHLVGTEIKRIYADAMVQSTGLARSMWPEDWKEIVQGLVAANLNVSEAARQLYVHRNTLLHKIERIYEVTGYDLRQLQDAMVLYLAASFF